MNYYRCSCGQREAWSTDDPSPCAACPHCGKTLAGHPDGHHEPVPHQWTTAQLGRMDNGQMATRTVCVVCGIPKFKVDAEDV